MKKITCFTANLTGGGAQHQLTLLANFLLEKGYEVTIVTYNNLTDHYILHRSINRVRLNVDGKNPLIKQWIITKYLWSLKTDCIISFRSTPNFICLLPFLFKKAPKIIAGERNTTINANLREKLNYNLLYNIAEYIVPNSYTQARYLQNLNKKWHDKVFPITNYTDTEEYKLALMPEDDSILKIGVFSRIFPQKNYVRFCEMLASMKIRANRKFQVVWYGDKKEGEYIKGSLHIRELILKYDLHEILLIKDAVKDVPQHMSEFHVMCLPSLYEGFSNSISEYICCGKVVLCSDVSDNSIMVHDGVNGFLFDPTNIESMCKAFEKVLCLNKEQLVSMGKESRKIAEKLFDKETFINKYIQLIES